MKLIPGNKYELKYSGKFCSTITSDGNEGFTPGDYIFVGNVLLPVGPRDIFMQSESGVLKYVMFSSEEGHESYVVDDKKEESIKAILNSIDEIFKLIAKLK